MHQQQGRDLILGHFQVAAQLDVAHGVLGAFVDIDRDKDLLLVGADRHLGRDDLHIDIAAVHVIRAQALQVTGQFLAGIFVIVLEERQPVAGLEGELIVQLGLVENAIAHHIDMLDRGHFAFVDPDLQADAVARLGNHLGVHRGRVTPLRHILAQQLIAYPFECGALEHFAFGQPGLLEAFHQVIGRDGLVAFNVDTGNGRTLDHSDHQHVAIAPQLDILEKTGLEQCTRGLHQLLVIDLFANVQGQGAEHAAGGHPLQAVDADIGNLEALGVGQ